jgi:biotin operon repressor
MDSLLAAGTMIHAGLIPDWPSLVYTRLWWGRDRAVTIGSLAEVMEVSRRTVEKAVEELRRTGAPVCTGSDGVWLSNDADELEAQVEALRRRAIHQMVGARALRRTARGYRKQQQLRLFDA